MKKFKNYDKLNNKGFSLLEVLVAVVILAIISTALIQGFVSVARSNARGKKLQDATDLAQNVAEYYGIKSLDSLKEQSSVDFSEIKPDNNKLNSIYVFEYDDTTCEEAFHVIAVMNPNKVEEYQNLNKEETPVLNHMYSNNSTYWMREFSRYDDDALNYIREQSSNASVSKSDITRKSTIDILVSNPDTEEPSQTKISVTYRLTVEYSCTIGGKNYHKTYTPGYRLVNFSSTQNYAPSLYLAYAPYNVSGTTCTDDVKINCSFGENVNWPKAKIPVYFISQDSTTNRKFTGTNNLTISDNSSDKNGEKALEIHTNLQDVVDAGKAYPMTTGGSLEIVSEAKKSIIYLLDVYILSKDEYDASTTNWIASEDNSDVTVPNYYTNFTTSTVK